MQAEWVTFLSILASGAIALLALLFVSFQLARERWIKKSMRRLVAIQTLLEFLAPAFFALIALLPARPAIFGFQLDTWQVGGYLAAIAGILVAGAVTRHAVEHRHSLDKFGRKQFWLQSVAFGEYILIFIFCMANSLVWTSVIMVGLLLSGSYETWEFFSELD